MPQGPRMNANPPRRGLGRGLGSLIPTTPSQPAPTADTAAANASGTSRTNGAAQRLAADPDGAAPVTGGVVAGAYFAELPITQVRPNARQPRQVFEEEALAELVHSIREVGLLQPVVVRK